jgi:hypothetical protein
MYYILLANVHLSHIKYLLQQWKNKLQEKRSMECKQKQLGV